MANRDSYFGIIPPTITPLKPDETLDEAAVGRVVRHCVDGGVSGIFVNGTSGEAMRVTDDVWQANLCATIHHTAGAVPVFCGAIEASTARVIEKLRIIEDAGGDVAVCTAPFYLSSFGQDEILRHFEALCAATRLPIAVYNIPETTGASILPETIARLADMDSIVAFKDSTADYQHLQRVLFALQDKDIAVFNGAEELCAASMLYGAQGCIPGLANFVPQLFVQLWQACVGGDIAASRALQEKINALRKVIFLSGCWMSGMKGLAKLFGLAGSTVSRPLEPWGEQHERQARQILAEAGIALT